MINPLAVNSIGTHQQLLQHIQQHLPAILKPVEATFHVVATHTVEDIPIDRDQNDKIDIHSTTDYSPWLHHLYRIWQHALAQRFGKLPHHPQYDQDAHWTPEIAAHALNDVALSYLGWLQHHDHLGLSDSMSSITLQWQDTWQLNQQEVEETHSNIGVKQALDNCAQFFHEYWLAACFHLAELATTNTSSDNIGKTI